MTTTRRWRSGVLAALLVVVGVTGCSDDKPKRSDVDDASIIVYPGATLVSESWEDAEKGEYIDAGSYDRPANLRVIFRLSEPETVGTIQGWATIELEAMNWAPTSE